MILDPPISMMFPLALLVVAIMCGVWVHRRLSARGQAGRLGLVALRLMAIAALVAILLSPSSPHTDTAPQDDRPTLCLLVDMSASMGVADPDTKPIPATRFEQVQRRWLNRDTLELVGRNHDLRVYGLSDQAHATTAALLGEQKPAAGASRLVAAVRQLLRNPAITPGSVMLLASDGHETTPVDLAGAASELAARATAAQVTIHVDPVGHTTGQPDFRVIGRISPAVRFAGQPASIVATVQRSNTDVAVASLRLTELDHTFEEHPVDNLVVRFAPDQTTRRISLPLPVSDLDPHPAKPTVDRQVHYRLSVEPLPEEVFTANNRAELFGQIIGRPIRALLIEGQPHWDSRFLARALGRDRQIVLTTLTAVAPDHMVIQSAPGNISEPPGSPTAQIAQNGSVQSRPGPMGQWLDDLVGRQSGDSVRPVINDLGPAQGSFDVVILGRQVERLLDAKAAEALGEHVAAGGGLIWSRGPAFDAAAPDGQRLYSQINSLDPIQWGRPTHRTVRLRATESTRSILANWFEPLTSLGDSGPPLTLDRQVQGLSPSAQVLLGHRSIDNNGVAGPVSEAEAEAAIVFQPSGRGRVVSIIPTGWHRWALDPSPSGQASALYQGLFSDLVRLAGLGPNQLTGTGLSMALDSQHLSPNHTQTVHLFSRYRPVLDWLDPAGGQALLQVISPRGETIDLAFTEAPTDPTHATAGFTPNHDGVHTVTVAPSGARALPNVQPGALRFIVADEDEELMDTSARHDWMIDLARRTGGAVMDPDTLTRWLADRSDPAIGHENRTRVRPVWDHPAWFVALVGLFSAEWWTRRRSGLR